MLITPASYMGVVEEPGLEEGYCFVIGGKKDKGKFIGSGKYLWQQDGIWTSTQNKYIDPRQRKACCEVIVGACVWMSGVDVKSLSAIVY